MSAYSTLVRAVDKIRHAEEQRLTAIRHAIQKAITSNELEGQRTFDKLTDKKNPNWALVAREGHYTNSIRAELKNALETLEACIQQHWERERHETRHRPPLVQLLDFATEPQRALVAEEFAGRFLAHREKARLRDRRYRERRSASETRREAPRRSMERINTRRRGKAHPPEMSAGRPDGGTAPPFATGSGVAPAWDTRRMDEEPKTVLHRELERRAPGAGTSNTPAPPAEVAK
jgi:hypothetical protein